MKKALKVFSAVTVLMIALTVAAVPVSADEGYWTDGWWDDATQTWYDGYWTEGTSDSCEGWWDDAAQIWHDGCNTDASTADGSGYAAAMSFTWYGQNDNARTVIGSGNMVDNGCVPTAAACLLSGYGISVSPEDMGWYLYDTGSFDNYYGHGGADLAWYDVAAYAGLNAYGIYDADSFASALQSGATVTCAVYRGSGTHSIFATGYDNGYTTVYDSISGTYTKSVQSIWNNRSFAWVETLSGTSVIAIGW